MSVGALRDALDAALAAEREAMGAAAEACQRTMAAGVRASGSVDYAGPEWVAYRDALEASVVKDQALVDRVGHRIWLAAEIEKRAGGVEHG